MQEPLPSYSEAHYKLARALAPLAGNPESYSRSDLVRLVRRKYPELSKNDVKPQKHCRNYGPSTPCACHQTGDALFEKLESADGNHRYRVLAVESAPVSFARPLQKIVPARPQPAASAFARAPVTPAPRPVSAIVQPPSPKASRLRASRLRISRPVVPGLALDLGGLLPGLLPRLKQWLFGEKLFRSVSMHCPAPAGRALAPLPPLPPLPGPETPRPNAEAPIIETSALAPASQSLSPIVPQISPQAIAEAAPDPAPTPAPAVLQVLRLPAPGGVQRLMVQHLTLAADAKLHLKLSPVERELSLELVHLHFRDSVVRELAVIGSEPLEIGFRLLGAGIASSRIELHGLFEGEWRLLQTSEQSFPVLPEQSFPVLPEQTALQSAQNDQLRAEQPLSVAPKSLAQSPAQAQKPAQEPGPDEVPALAEPSLASADALPASALSAAPLVDSAEASIEQPASEAVSPSAWLDELPELYRPLLLHIQTHGSLSEGAMIGLLGGGNAGARKARAFAVQVDKWQACLPFELEIMHTPEGKTYCRA